MDVLGVDSRNVLKTVLVFVISRYLLNGINNSLFSYQLSLLIIISTIFKSLNGLNSVFPRDIYSYCALIDRPLIIGHISPVRSMASISPQQRLIRLSKSTALLSLELSNPPKLSPTTLREVLFAPTEESTVDNGTVLLRLRDSSERPNEISQKEPAQTVERERQSSKRPTLRRQSSAVAQQLVQLPRQSSVRFELSAGGRLPEAELDFSPRLLLLYFGAGWSVPCVSSTRRLRIVHRAWSTQPQSPGAAAAGDEASDEFENPAVLYVPSDEDEQSAVSSFRSSHGGWWRLRSMNGMCTLPFVYTVQQ